MYNSGQTITITLNGFGNSHFSSEQDIADSLRKLADRFENGEEPSKVMDINGNKVGTVEYLED